MHTFCTQTTMKQTPRHLQSRPTTRGVITTKKVRDTKSLQAKLMCETLFGSARLATLEAF